jgi:hypothetical protein
LAENPDVQIHKKAIKELGYDNPVDQSGLKVNWYIKDQWIPQAYSENRQTPPPHKA